MHICLDAFGREGVAERLDPVVEQDAAGAEGGIGGGGIECGVDEGGRRQGHGAPKLVVIGGDLLKLL